MRSISPLCSQSCYANIVLFSDHGVLFHSLFARPLNAHTVQVSDSLGHSLTLGPVTLNVLPSNSSILVITWIDYLGDHVRLYFTSQTGLQYYVQQRQDLDSGSWSTVGPPVAGTGGMVYADVPVVLPLRQFYRILGQPH